MLLAAPKRCLLRWELRGAGGQEAQDVAAALHLQALQTQRLFLSRQLKRECGLSRVL